MSDPTTCTAAARKHIRLYHFYAVLKQPLLGAVKHTVASMVAFGNVTERSDSAY